MLTELIVLLLGSIYSGVRSVILGIYSDEVEVHDQTSKISYNLRSVITGLIIGLSIALFMGIRSSVLFAETITLQTRRVKKQRVKISGIHRKVQG